MRRGPTITSGQAQDVDWRAGLEDAVFLCTGRKSTGSPRELPTSSGVGPFTTQPLGSGPLGSGTLGSAPWLTAGLMDSDTCLIQPKQELHTVLQSPSFDSTQIQQSSGVFGPGGSLHGGSFLSGSVHERFSMPQLLMEEGRDESRAGFVNLLPQNMSFSPIKQEPQVKERRKVGRPIMHRGDPDDPNLTEKERRRIKRRIANRESAQRVRHRRQEELEEMQAKLDEIHGKNCELRQRLEEGRQQRIGLAGEVEDMRGRLNCLAADNHKMEAVVQALRQSLQLKMGSLECELDRREAAADHVMTYSPPCGSTTQQPMADSHPPCNPTSASMIPLEMQNSECLAPFPSLDLDLTRREAGLPPINLDSLLDPYFPYPAT